MNQRILFYGLVCGALITAILVGWTAVEADISSWFDSLWREALHFMFRFHRTAL